MANLQGEYSYRRADSIHRFNVGRVHVLNCPPCLARAQLERGGGLGDDQLVLVHVRLAAGSFRTSARAEFGARLQGECSHTLADSAHGRVQEGL